MADEAAGFVRPGLWWDVKLGDVMRVTPFHHLEPTTKWFVQGSMTNSVSFQAGSHVKGVHYIFGDTKLPAVDFIAAMSKSGGWIANMNSSTGQCTFHDLRAGQAFAACSSLFLDKLSDGEASLCIVAHGAFLAVSSSLCTEVIVVQKVEGTVLDGWATKVSSTAMSRSHKLHEPGGESVPIALNDSYCAITCNGFCRLEGQFVRLYRLGPSGLESCPCSVLESSSQEPYISKFWAVALTTDKLITLEHSRDEDKVIVVRDILQPCGPPLHKMKFQLCHLIACRVGLLEDVESMLAVMEQRETVLQDERVLPVFENVDHPEAAPGAAAEIPPEEAQMIVAEQWASAIERRISAGDDSPTVSNAALVLTFARHPQDFDTVLRRAPLGQRLVAIGQDLQPDWANGAKIIVPALDQETWWESGAGVQLSSYHVVVLEEDVEQILEALQSLPCRCRPRLKPGVPAAAVEYSGHSMLMRDLSSDSASPLVGQFAGESQSDSSVSLDVHTDSSVSQWEEDNGNDEFSRQAWLAAVKQAVEEATRVCLTVQCGFIDFPGQSPPVSPRTIVTESAPPVLESSNPFVQSARFPNPRIWTGRHV